jgi:type IV pilus assembly protein PilN
MRIPINLASEPFRRDRSTVVAAGILCAILVVSAVGLTYLILAERERAEENREMVARLNSQVAAVSKEQAEINNFMREPANAAMLEQSLFLNSLIQRKSISWARLFADIEGVLPGNVKLVQVRLPQMDAKNRVTLDLEVGAKNTADAIDFFTRLQNSPLFGPASLLRQDPPSDNDPSWRYRLTVSYGQTL